MFLLVPSTKTGMDAQVPQSAIDGSQLVFSLGFIRVSELSVGKVRQLGECIEL